MLYYTIVNLSTAGYGDIYPRTALGQMLVIGLFLALLIPISTRYGHYTKVSSLSSQYSRATYVAKPSTKHIILMGECDLDAIDTFLNECFHADHGTSQTDVVILRNSDPTDGIEKVIGMPKFEQKVKYIKGNPLDKSDLDRCKLHLADCVIILSNPFSPNPL